MSIKDEARTVGDVERHLQFNLAVAKNECGAFKRLYFESSEEVIRLLALIREFVEADAEMDREMERTNLEDFVQRPPAFDRYDAAVAALKEAVK